MKLEDYGLIADMGTAALVGVNGSIDWWCVPRFDSDACFAALLGTDDHGHWKIAPKDAAATSRHAYRGNTLILETDFATPTGKVRLIDCMPPERRQGTIVRVVEGLSGEVEMAMHLVIRFDYGRTIPWVRRENDVLSAIGGPNALALRCNVETHGQGLSTVSEFSVRAGEQKTFVLQWHLSHEPIPAAVDPLAILAGAERFWEKWAARCTYQGEWRTAVMRSLLTLKALTYVPTGGIVAAPTTSLPEQLGGVRNWDYRFCWLRDATFTLYSLMDAGYTEEAADWIQWLLRAAAGDPAQLQIMYGAAGERTLTELELPHLPGYENSRPVRTGNAAAAQFQLDVYGEVLDAMHKARNLGIVLSEDSWHLLRHVVEFVGENWTRPDEGIWEMRGPRRHFTHSKVMAWVAMDRGIKLVDQFGFSADVVKWREIRQAIHDSVCQNGFNEVRQAFTQYYGSDKLDASILMMPLVGFLPASDSRCASTIAAIESDLMVDGLVLRYHPAESAAVDGLPPGEGTFLPCSFWMVDCLYLLGQMKKARALFQHLLSLTGTLGLLAEEYDTRVNRLVGNFPQAFSHVGLVNSALNLSRAVGPADVRSETSSPYP